MISDGVWAWMASLLPDSAGKRGGQWRDHRQVVEGIAWKFRTGSPWRDLPERYGPWQTVWKRHDLWSRDGTYQRLLEAAQTRADSVGDIDWVVLADSSIVPAHQHAAGARTGRGARGAGSNHKRPRQSRPSEPADHAIGRSRGGRTTKIHPVCNGLGRPLAVHLTGGNVTDTTELERLLGGIRVPRIGPGRPRTRPDHLIADKGYSSRANRALRRRRGIRATIPNATTNSPIDDAAAAPEDGRSGSTRPPTGAATSSNVPSTSSNNGAALPPATTRPPPTTTARSPSPACSSG